MALPLWVFVVALLVPVTVIGLLTRKLINLNSGKKVRKERKGAKKQIQQTAKTLTATPTAVAAPVAESEASSTPNETEVKKTD
jgi:archaellum component FlaG (FlaF/FlaG flagellin family)